MTSKTHLTLDRILYAVVSTVLVYLFVASEFVSINYDSVYGTFIVVCVFFIARLIWEDHDIEIKDYIQSSHRPTSSSLMA